MKICDHCHIIPGTEFPTKQRVAIIDVFSDHEKDLYSYNLELCGKCRKLLCDVVLKIIQEFRTEYTK